MTNVKIENGAQFIADFHENVPNQSDEDAQDQLDWMAMHAPEYPDSRIWMGAPANLTADYCDKRFWFNVTTNDDGGLTMAYTNVANEDEES